MNDPALVIKSVMMPALVESLYMTFWGTVFSCILGFGLAVILVVTAEDGLSPHKWVYRLLNVLVNTLRSFPFIILAVTIIPITRAVMGTSIGTNAALFPLVIVACPFVARVFEGNLKAVTEAVVSSSRESVNLCISMAGIVGMWTGLMKIAEGSGLIEGLSGKMGPVLRFLFPGLDPDSRAGRYISVNFLSNILGLGWAATPAGLKAMEELSNLEQERRDSRLPALILGVASNVMCTFLILNISSLQLIPVNIIAYRSQYGAVSPAAIVGPAIIATSISTLAAVIFIKLRQAFGRVEK